MEPSPNVPLYTVVDKKIKSKRSSTPEYSGAESDGMYSMITEESMKGIDSGKHIDENKRKVKGNNSVASKTEAAKSHDANLSMKKDNSPLCSVGTHLYVLCVFIINKYPTKPQDTWHVINWYIRSLAL